MLTLARVSGVDHAAEQPLHRRWNRQPFREQHQALAPGQPAHRLDDRKQAIGGGVALLIALHELEVANHARGHLRETQIARRAAHRIAGARTGRRGRTRHLLSRAARLPIGVGLLLLLFGAVEAGGAALAHVVERPPKHLDVPGEGGVWSEADVDAEDADVDLGLGLVAQIALRRLDGEPPRFGAQPVEHQRRHNRTVVSAGRRLGRTGGCWFRGWRGSRGRRRRTALPLDDRRERSKRLRDAVLEDLKVRLRQIAHRQSTPIAHDHVDEHRRDALVQRAGRALDRRLLTGIERGQRGEYQGSRHQAGSVQRFHSCVTPVRCVRRPTVHRSCGSAPAGRGA